MKDIRMGNIFSRWDLKILGWEISFYDGMIIIPMGCEDIPMG
jgi:hypothetical protein